MKKLLIIFAAAVLAACSKPEIPTPATPLSDVIPATKALAQDALDGTFWTELQSIHVLANPETGEAMDTAEHLLLWFEGGRYNTCLVRNIYGDDVFYRVSPVNGGAYAYDADSDVVQMFPDWGFPYEITPRRVMSIDGGVSAIVLEDGLHTYKHASGLEWMLDEEYIAIKVTITVDGWQ